MNLTTSQWRSVSSGMPFSAAMRSPSGSSHSSGSTRKPSASTAGAVVLMDPPSRNRKRPRRKQRVPVEPLEPELTHVVQTRLAQKRQRAEASGMRLELVVEVDQQRLVEARFDEAGRPAVVARFELVAGEKARDVLHEYLALEVRDRAGLRRDQVGRVAEREDVRLRASLQRVRVGGDEAERIAQACRPLDERGAAVQRHGDEEVVGELAAVVRRDRSIRDLAGCVLDLQLDVLLE